MPNPRDGGGLNIGHRPTRTFDFDENNPEFRYDLPANVRLLGIHLRVSGQLTIATGGEDAILSQSIYRLLPRLSVESPLGTHYPNSFGMREHAAIWKHITGNDNAFPFDEPADATAQTDTDIEAEGWITFAPGFLAGGPADMHIPPISPTEVFELVGRWNTEKTNASSDAGTGAIVEDTDSSDNAVTWDDEPSVEITPVYAYNMPKPYAILRASISTGESFDTAQDPYHLRIRTPHDTPFMVLQALDNGGTEDLADLIDQVTVGERSDWSNISREALDFLTRKDYHGVGTDEPGELALPFAHRGRLGTRLKPTTDLQADDLRLKTTTPSGTAKIRAILLHAIRMENAGVTRPFLARSHRGNR